MADHDTTNHGGALAALQAELERDYDACSARGANGRAARCRAWLAALDAALAVVGAAKRYTEDSQWCEEFEEALARFFGEGAEPSGGGGK